MFGIGNRPYLLLALAPLFWSGNHIFGRAFAEHAPPFSVATLRWAFPALLLSVIAWRHLRNDWPAVKAHWRIFFLLSLCGGSLFTGLQYLGLHYTTALNVSVLNSLGPVSIAVTGAILFGDRLLPRQMVGIATSMVGVLAIVTQLDLDVALHFRFNFGDILMLSTVVGWGVYSAFLRFVPQVHWLTFIFMLAAFSAIEGAPIMLWELTSGQTFELSWLVVGAVAYVAIFPSILAYGAWNRGVALIGGNRSAPFLHLTPLYSAVLAVVLLGERIRLYHVVGFALILVGVYLAARRGPKPENPQ
ncbi:MAG: DMT family transporter [Variibacter sp.]